MAPARKVKERSWLEIKPRRWTEDKSEVKRYTRSTALTQSQLTEEEDIIRSPLNKLTLVAVWGAGLLWHGHGHSGGSCWWLGRPVGMR